MWRRNGLSIVLLGLMLVFLAAQALTGWAVHNEELAQYGAPPLGFGAYLLTGHFSSATFENWESEFLQMGMYVLLTVRLRQRGSAESRPLEPAEETPRIEPGTTPWPVRKGGIWRRLYEHSLAIAFMALFVLSFSLHAAGSWRAKCDEARLEGLPVPGFVEHLLSSDFWFESMQNWQSEFLAVLALVLLTIVLRQKDSPQSKAVEAPHSQTGD
ncbi:membrane protein [Luteimonas sp. FCS-9]|nr:membrane protein [Luteimonas sp. FCS-9]